MKQSPINKVSKKRSSEMMTYHLLVAKLRMMCGNISELNGTNPDWQSDYLVEPHHIRGRIGNLYLDVFNIIMLTRLEHDIQEGKIRGQRYSETELLDFIRPKRLLQGFRLNKGA